MPDNVNNLPAINYKTPFEMLSICFNNINKVKVNDVVWLRGIYRQRPNQNQQWAMAYDELQDTNSQTTITLKVRWQDRSGLSPNSLVLLGGMLELNPFSNGNIQLALAVTRYEIIKDQYVTEEDIKRQGIRVAKSKKGFKNVDALLEDKLLKDERPKVALLFATTSITMSDFNAGVKAAAVKIDFSELRQNFGNAATLSSYLANIDHQQYDVIAMIRGGGNGRESLDDVRVLEAVANMKTPVICAIGHVEEGLFLKTISDKVAPTPNGLGQYFHEMVNRVAEKRNNSRAVLVKEVEGQYKKQIEDSKKQNEALLKQVENLRKQSDEQTKAFKEAQEKQLNENKAALEKLQKENKETLDKLQQENKESLDKLQKENREALDKLQKQNKETLDKVQKQNTDQMDALTKMHKATESRLTEQNNKISSQLESERRRTSDLQQQLAEAQNRRSGCLPMAVAAAVIGFIIMILI